MQKDILTATIEKTAHFGDDYNCNSYIVPLIISELYNTMQPQFPNYVVSLCEPTTRHFMATVWEELIAPFYATGVYPARNGRSTILLYVWPLMEYLGKEGYTELNALKFWSGRNIVDLEPYANKYWGKYCPSRLVKEKMMEKYPLEESRWTYNFCPSGPTPESYTSLVKNLLDCKDKNPLLKNGRWCPTSQCIVYDKPLPYVEDDQEFLDALAKVKREYQVRVYYFFT
jgi:hypothetical protein